MATVHTLLRQSSSLALLLVLSAESAARPDPAPAPEDQALPEALGERLDAELAVSGGLTADAVAARAVATSFDVRARRAELLQAAAGVDRALWAYLPKVSVSSRYVRLSSLPASRAGSVVVAPDAPAGPLAPGTPLVNVPLTFPAPLDQYSLQAGLSVPVTDYFLRFPRSKAAARHGERAATFAEAAAKRRAAADGRIAYYGWVHAKLELVIAEQSLSQTRAHLADVQVAEQAGTATPADLLAVRAQVAASTVLVERTRTLNRVAEERLRTLMHETHPRELRIGEDVRARPRSFGDEGNLETLFRAARRARPELLAMDARVAALREKVGVERAGMLPRLDGFANAQYSNPNSRAFPQRDEFRGTWDVGAALSWTLSDVPGASAGARGVEAEVATAQAERSALEDAIRMEIADALQSVLEADASVEPTAERLASAAEAYRVRRELFRNGRATSVELTDAEAELTRSRVEALNNRVNQRVARVRLAHAVGLRPAT